MDERNYIDRLALQIYQEAEKNTRITVEEMPLYRMYALLALAKGKATTLEDVHNAWAAWRSATNPQHRALKPFADLTKDVQELDRPYVNAIHTVAKK